MIDEYNSLIKHISAMISANSRIFIAIDGNSGAGKTTLAEKIQQIYDCNVFHMDDFFLRPEQRTSARLSEPGGNVDYERFLSEVLKPAHAGHAVAYRRYDCKTGKMLSPVRFAPRQINITEGSYSLHPTLKDYYSLSVFMTVSPEEQMKRIIMRNGAEQAKVFRNKWIILENKYFEAFDVKDSCDFVLNSVYPLNEL